MTSTGIYVDGWVDHLYAGGRVQEVWATHPTSGRFMRVWTHAPFGEYSGPTRVLRNGKPIRELSPEAMSVWLTARDSGGTNMVNALLSTGFGDLVGYSSYQSSPSMNATHLSLYREIKQGYEKDHRTEAYRAFQDQWPAFVTAYQEGTL